MSSRPRVAIHMFGDSIAASMLADTTMGETLSSHHLSRLGTARRLIAEDRLHGIVLRDAIQNLGAAPDRNAFGGDLPYSHRKRLEALLGTTVTVTSFAKNSARVESLFEQISEARGALAKAPAAGMPTAHYVTLIVGSNDVCAGMDPQSFRETFHFRLYQILKTYPDATVLVTHVPDVVSVLTIPDQVAFKAHGRTFMCKQFQDQFREPSMCPGLEVTAETSRAQARAAQDMIRTFNRIIDEEVARQRDERGSYSPYGGRLIAAPLPLSDKPIAGALLSADCYHPSAAGHASLAELTWPAVAPALAALKGVGVSKK